MRLGLGLELELELELELGLAERLVLTLVEIVRVLQPEPR